MLTRRPFGALALSTVPLARAARFDSVKIGNQSYSFRDMPLDAAIQAMAAMGMKECELSQGHMEPPKLDREALRKWIRCGRRSPAFL